MRVRIQFTRSARKHKIGKAHALAALAAAGEPTCQSDDKLLWVGSDDRGVELEIVGVVIPAEDLILIIHVMPTSF